MGASATRIVQLLSREFFILVILSNIIAWPAAWFVLKNWLQNFVYRINISWWVFVIAGILAFIIALLTVSLQALKAARTNPAEALRYE